jgi:hypothetical protein
VTQPEPEWQTNYVTRKCAEVLAELHAVPDEEWCGHGYHIAAAAETVIRQVMADMAIHLTHPHTPAPPQRG